MLEHQYPPKRQTKLVMLLRHNIVNNIGGECCAEAQMFSIRPVLIFLTHEVLLTEPYVFDLGPDYTMAFFRVFFFA